MKLKILILIIIYQMILFKNDDRRKYMANLDPRKLMLINEFKNMASGKSSD